MADYLTLKNFAVFSLARKLWEIDDEKELFRIPNRNDDINHKAIRSEIFLKIDRIRQYVIKLDLCVSNSFIEQILLGVSSIGEQILDFIFSNYQSATSYGLDYYKRHPENLSFKDIPWSPYLTIDLMKLYCQTKNFSLSRKVFCFCCLNNLMDNYYDTIVALKLNEIFGEYKYHALSFLFIFCHTNRFHKILFLFEDTNANNYSQIENIFLLSVYCGCDTATIYYWSQLKPAQKSSCIQVLLNSQYYCFDYGKFHLNFSRSFWLIWHNINEHERIRLMGTKINIFKLLFSWPGEDDLLFFLKDHVLDINLKFLTSYLHFMILVVPYFHDTYTYRRIFHLIWNLEFKRLMVSMKEKTEDTCDKFILYWIHMLSVYRPLPNYECAALIYVQYCRITKNWHKLHNINKWFKENANFDIFSEEATYCIKEIHR